MTLDQVHIYIDALQPTIKDTQNLHEIMNEMEAELTYKNLGYAITEQICSFCKAGA